MYNFGKFRFWCQKVLPLVYDNSLSYYELLCKVVDYLNKTMEDVDHMNTDMDTLYSNFQEFQEGTIRIYNELVAYVNAYFDNLDVQEEINNKLDDMVTSGELVTILQPSIASEVADWLSEHITPTTPTIDDTLTVSGAGADAKRTGDALASKYSASKTYINGDLCLYNGVIYRAIIDINTPEAFNSSHWINFSDGDGINEILHQLDINTIGQIYLPSKLIRNTYIEHSNGEETPYSGWSSTDFIPFTSEDYLYINTSLQTRSVGLYDVNKNFITSPTLLANGYRYTMDNDSVKYIRISNPTIVMLNTLVVINKNTDPSLSKSGYAADSKRTGEIIKMVQEGLGVKDLVKNNIAYYCQYHFDNYINGHNFDMSEIAQIPLNKNTSYILYVGELNTPSTTGCVRIYIKYEGDSDYKRYDSYNHILKFETENRNITECSLYLLATNGETLVDSGEYYCSEVVIFEGAYLELIDYINVNTIPSYYNDPLKTKISNVNYIKNNCSFNGDSFIFITDTHYTNAFLYFNDADSTTYNTNHSPELIKEIIKKTGIEKIVFGGDLSNSAPDVNQMLVSMNNFYSMLDEYQYRLRYCVGNHEYYTDLSNPQSGRPSTNSLYGSSIKFNENIVKGKGPMDTYYFDNEIQKIRYYIISCGRDTELTIPQVEWLFGEFRNIPSGYNVVCVGHAFITDNMDDFRGYYKNIMAALDAIKARTTFTFNGNTYDYSSLQNVTVIGAFTGHTHIDGSLVTAGGITCICTTCDSWAQNYELVNGTPTNVPREKNSINEQAFDIVQISLVMVRLYAYKQT